MKSMKVSGNTFAEPLLRGEDKNEEQKKAHSQRSPRRMDRRRGWVRPVIGSCAVVVGLAVTCVLLHSSSDGGGAASGGVGGVIAHYDDGGHPHPHDLHEATQEHDESAMAAMVDGAEHDLSLSDHDIGEASHEGGDSAHGDTHHQPPASAHRDDSHYGYGAGSGARAEIEDVGCPSLSGGGEVSLVGKPRRGWVMHTGPGRQYAHMPTLARTASGRLIAAWQGAKHGEGGGDQSIFTAVALDPGGTKWASPRRVGSHSHGSHAAQVGARWGPVLFQPPRGGPLHLFYSESSTCWFCRDPRCRLHHLKHGAGAGYQLAPGVRPAEWRAGGTIFLVTSVDDGASWGTRRVVLAEKHEGNVPKVCVLNPKSFSLNPLPYTLYPLPFTLNPKP
jgi:hypothetical protein